jgi:hypothetical protein
MSATVTRCACGTKLARDNDTGQCGACAVAEQEQRAYAVEHPEVAAQERARQAAAAAEAHEVLEDMELLAEAEAAYLEARRARHWKEKYERLIGLTPLLEATRRTDAGSQDAHHRRADG